jgi:hypothetical protein
MPGKSLWGDLSDLEIVRTPKEILKEQADALTEATEGVLVGRVGAASGTGNSFSLELSVFVPRLNNYTYTILTADHKIDLYPVRVFPSTTQRYVTCENEQTFIKALEEILSSKEVKRILSRLLSQVS